MSQNPDQSEQIPGDPEPDDYDAGRCGDLGTVTDQEWRHAHERLRSDLAGLVPPEQLAYTWAPGRSAAERSTGGGFRD